MSAQTLWRRESSHHLSQVTSRVLQGWLDHQRREAFVIVKQLCLHK